MTKDKEIFSVGIPPCLPSSKRKQRLCDNYHHCADNQLACESYAVWMKKGTVKGTVRGRDIAPLAWQEENHMGRRAV